MKKYNILLDNFLRNTIDPQWQYPNAKIKNLFNDKVIIEATSHFGVQHLTIQDFNTTIQIKWHIFITADLQNGANNTAEGIWTFAASDNQEEMANKIFDDMTEIASKNGFLHYL